jgi:hypothetical protein
MFGVGYVSSNVSYFKGVQSFDAETTRAMGEAFDDICKHLHDRGQPEIVRDVIAKQIIEAAKRGERDPSRLRDSVLASFGLKPTTTG